MTFDVRRDALVVENDGVFSDCEQEIEDQCPWEASGGVACDFHSFRRVQGGTKRGRADTTGAFGIGFTSVYQITDEPDLTSGTRRWVLRLAEPESRRIQQQILDAPLPGTKLVLPWAYGASTLRDRLRAEPVDRAAPKRMLSELVAAVPRAMVFLRRVRTIEIRRNGAPVKTFSRADDPGVVNVSDARTTMSWRILSWSFDEVAVDLRASYPQIEDKREAITTIAIDTSPDPAVVRRRGACMPSCQPSNAASSDSTSTLTSIQMPTARASCWKTTTSQRGTGRR